MTDFIEELNKAGQSGKAFAAAVITAAEGSTPRRPGAKMLIFEDGSLSGTIGGGAIELQVIRDALESLRSKEPVMKTYPVIQTDGRISGQETVYIEPILPKSRLILCGAGHVAGHLIPIAKSIGFHVTVIDIRDEEKVRARAAAADRFILAGTFAEGLKQIPEDPGDFLIACAFNFEQDEEILFRLAGRQSAYVGMLAGRQKIRTIFANLRERGVTEAQLAKVRAPIGLPLGGETPEEIALSIAAELLQERNKKE